MREEENFADVQRLVLHGSIWNFGRHLSLEFPERLQPLPPLKNATPSHPLTFLATERDRTRLCRPTGAWPAKRPEVQLSIGFSRRGLAKLDVPPHVLSFFALKTPAFTAGAALRSSRHLGTSGRSAPPHWDESFHHMKLDAVLSLHGDTEHTLDGLVDEIENVALHYDVIVRRLPATRRLANAAGVAEPAHNGIVAERREEWTHFGFRDGLARIGISGWTEKKKLAECKPSSIHRAGEFVLGHPQDSGANPYIAGPGLRVWPEEVRAFFHNGSFAVVHQMEQHVEVFDEFIAKEAKRLKIDDVDELKAKLCGRHPNGRVLSGAPSPGQVDADFDFADDADGRHCPFGSHIRRMNPRAAIDADGALAHAARRRALLRRGMPYVRLRDVGPVQPGKEEHGFIGHFFCASIEDQFEHLVGQWGERVPLGSADRGRARDPLIGAHEYDDGDFEIPTDDPRAPLTVKGLRPFVRVVGTSYLFYPSLSTFDGIVASKTWTSDPDDEADA